MEKENKILINKLKQKGLKLTSQRIAILNKLYNCKYPLTAASIYSEIKDEYPEMRLSTVYRNLNIFTQKKMIRKLDIELNNNKAYFEMVEGDHHHHLVCIKCQQISPLMCPENYMNELKEKTDYTILEHKLKVYGLCKKCK